MSYGKNGRILIREIPADPLGDSWHIWNIFGITFEPETLETSSRALKTCILTYTTSQKIAAWDRMMTSYN